MDIILTADGSNSVRSSRFGETYHSRHGAIQETEHVFIQSALVPAAQRNTTLRVLDVGFGTGLNALMSLEYAYAHGLTLHYTTVEAYPLAAEDAAALNYVAQLGTPNAAEYFALLHNTAWGATHPLPNGSTLTKIHAKLETLAPDDPAFADAFDVVYHDAFAPDIQPELWTPAIFARLYHALSVGGILTTYSAKGDVRRGMQSVGFNVERLRGPIGKLEMLRGTK